MPELRTGTVTLLFTDSEGSTRWEQHRDAMQAALALHDSILQEAIEPRVPNIFPAFILPDEVGSRHR